MQFSLFLFINHHSFMFIHRYNNSQNNYNNRDHRDGGYRNNQRNNQNNYNNRYNKHNNQNNYNQNGYNQNSYNQNNYNQNNYNNSHNNNFMNNNKDMAPRFKRTLIPPTTDTVENLQMRPAANSLLFKANNMSIKTTLPLTTPPPQKLNNTPTIPMVSNHNNISSSSSSNTNNDTQNKSTKDSATPTAVTIKIQETVKPVNNLLNKEQILIKQASLEKPNKQNKKTKGPSKDEVLKKVSAFISETLFSNDNSQNNSETTITSTDAVAAFLELKVPDKFLKDSVLLILYEVLDKNDTTYDRIIDFLITLKKESKINNQALLESFKLLCNGMNEREATIPRITTHVASLFSRAVSSKLCNLADISTYTENGHNYPLFLLILQQLHKNLGKQALLEIFNERKINLMVSLPEADRTKDRMAEILEDRNLSFLYPLIKVQAELWKQIQVDSNPHQFYKWIKENVESSCLTDPGFITAMMTVLIKYITQVLFRIF